jgi:small-conductance mechanosensitive channel
MTTYTWGAMNGVPTPFTWPPEALGTLLAAAVPVLLKALVVLALMLLVGRSATHAFDQVAGRGALDRSTRLLGGRIIRLAVLIVGGTVLLDLFGVPPATLIAAIGVVGLAVSLALQDLLRNFFSGIYLLFERPFEIGDTIKVRDNEGVVEYVGFRTLTLRTARNEQILIPNSMVVAEVVANRTHIRPAPEEPPDPATAA